MGNSLGVYETNYKVKQVKNLLLGKIWPPSDLLFLEWSYCSYEAVEKGSLQKHQKAVYEDVKYP